jgi:hypothetical protein
MRHLALFAFALVTACFPKLDDPDSDAADVPPTDTPVLQDAELRDLSPLSDASPADAVPETVTPPPPSTRLSLQLGATVLRGDRGWVVVGPLAGATSRLD